MRRFVREHSLSIVTFGAFLVIWFGGQTWTGHRSFNEEQRAHGEPTVSFSEYLTQAHFGEATFENWESEFLQMGVYVVLTAWLVQKGSAESKPPEGDPTVEADPREHRAAPDAPWPVRRGGWVLRIYENSLSIVMLSLFAAGLRRPPRHRRPRLQRRTGRTWRADDLHLGLPVPLTVLVRVTAELAIRVPRRRQPRGPQRVPPPTRLTRIQARQRTACQHRRLVSRGLKGSSTTNGPISVVPSSHGRQLNASSRLVVDPREAGCG